MSISTGNIWECNQINNRTFLPFKRTTSLLRRHTMMTFHKIFIMESHFLKCIVVRGYFILPKHPLITNSLDLLSYEAKRHLNRQSSIYFGISYRRCGIWHCLHDDLLVERFQFIFARRARICRTTHKLIGQTRRMQFRRLIPIYIALTDSVQRECPAPGS